MALLITFRSVSKQFGSEPLFRDISFTISDGERHGLVGPNGAGKSTLLALAAGSDHPDEGEVIPRKRVRMTYVAQEPRFSPGKSVRDIVEAAHHEEANVDALLGQAGFRDPSQQADQLSGGWRKRLAIAEALATMPDLLLLDEPTNHLDLEGIEWLEGVLAASPFGCLVVSHDRYFLERVATNMMELNRVYPNGLFRAEGNYSRFLEKRGDYFAAQDKERDSLATRVRREVAWLQRGAKARTTKAKARVDTALEQVEALNELDSRRRTSSVAINFTATDRQTKRLLVAEDVNYSFGDVGGIQDVSLILTPGTRVGLAGPNGSGKTTLLRLFLGQMPPHSGEIRRADNLRTVYFDQHREQVDPTVSLRRALAPEGDSVIYQDRVVHVNGWARRFLFRLEQLDQPVAKLSGGERARLAIARLMLQPADILLLDEPTNDLDIPTLEILEESLLEFPGAMILVTHDRYLMDRVAQKVLGLLPGGGSGIFADLGQWEAARDEALREIEAPASKPQTSAARDATAAARKKFSYLEQREWDAMEEKILQAEELLAQKQEAIQTAASASLELAYQELQAAQAAADALYARWAELEAKLT